MKAIPAVADHFEFIFPSLGTLVRVETRDSSVTVRASSDSFSDQRKEFFVRELVAEGFIPESSAWGPISSDEAPRIGVLWIVDRSILEIDPAIRAGANRLLLRVLSGSVLLFAVLLGLLFSGHLGNRRHQPPAIIKAIGGLTMAGP